MKNIINKIPRTYLIIIFLPMIVIEAVKGALEWSFLAIDDWWHAWRDCDN